MLFISGEGGRVDWQSTEGWGVKLSATVQHLGSDTVKILLALGCDAAATVWVLLQHFDAFERLHNCSCKTLGAVNVAGWL